MSQGKIDTFDLFLKTVLEFFFKDAFLWKAKTLFSFLNWLMMDSETKKEVILFIQTIHFSWLMVQRSNANLVTLKNGIKMGKKL